MYENSSFPLRGCPPSLKGFIKWYETTSYPKITGLSSIISLFKGADRIEEDNKIIKVKKCIK